jgi:hypothetical protein
LRALGAAAFDPVFLADFLVEMRFCAINPFFLLQVLFIIAQRSIV